MAVTCIRPAPPEEEKSCRVGSRANVHTGPPPPPPPGVVVVVVAAAVPKLIGSWIIPGTLQPSASLSSSIVKHNLVQTRVTPVNPELLISFVG